MHTPSPPSRESEQSQRERQPAPSGEDGAANQGSPATGVMKQFAKTDAERGDQDADAKRQPR